MADRDQEIYDALAQDAAGDEDEESTIDEDADTDAAGEEDPTEDLRERMSKMEAALRKANAEAKKYRLKAKANGTPNSDDEPAAESTDERWRGVAIRAEARAALAEAGFSGNAGQSKKLARMLDLDDIEVSDDGEVDFGDQIEELKTDFPQLFKSESDEGDDELAPRRRRAPKVSTADKGRTARKSVSATDRQVAALLGRT